MIDESDRVALPSPVLVDTRAEDARHMAVATGDAETAVSKGLLCQTRQWWGHETVRRRFKQGQTGRHRNWLGWLPILMKRRGRRWLRRGGPGQNGAGERMKGLPGRKGNASKQQWREWREFASTPLSLRI